MAGLLDFFKDPVGTIQKAANLNNLHSVTTIGGFDTVQLQRSSLVATISGSAELTSIVNVVIQASNMSMNHVASLSEAERAKIQVSAKRLHAVVSGSNSISNTTIKDVETLFNSKVNISGQTSEVVKLAFDLIMKFPELIARPRAEIESILKDAVNHGHLRQIKSGLQPAEKHLDNPHPDSAKTGKDLTAWVSFIAEELIAVISLIVALIVSVSTGAAGTAVAAAATAGVAAPAPVIATEVQVALEIALFLLAQIALICGLYGNLL